MPQLKNKKHETFAQEYIIDIEHAVELANRRLGAMLKDYCCPNCGSKNIRLVDWWSSETNFDYKCRDCNFAFGVMEE